MKKSFKRIVFLLVSIMTIVALSNIAYAYSMKDTICLHDYTKGAKDSISCGYSNDDYHTIKCKLISNSNPSVVSAKIDKSYENNQMLQLTAKKRGASVVKYRYYLDDEIVVTWTKTVKVVKYNCPFKQFKIGKTDLTKYFKYRAYRRISKKSLNGKLSLKLNSGWKLVDGCYRKTSTTSNLKTIKNGSNVVCKSGGDIFLNFVNKKANDNITVILSLK